MDNLGDNGAVKNLRDFFVAKGIDSFGGLDNAMFGKKIFNSKRRYALDEGYIEFGLERQDASTLGYSITCIYGVDEVRVKMNAINNSTEISTNYRDFETIGNNPNTRDQFTDFLKYIGYSEVNLEEEPSIDMAVGK